MDLFRDLYFFLFAAGADALEAMEQGDLAEAHRILTEAQCAAEDRYLDAAEEEESSG